MAGWGAAACECLHAGARCVAYGDAPGAAVVLHLLHYANSSICPGHRRYDSARMDSYFEEPVEHLIPSIAATLGADAADDGADCFGDGEGDGGDGHGGHGGHGGGDGGDGEGGVGPPACACSENSDIASQYTLVSDWQACIDARKRATSRGHEGARSF